MKIKNEYLPHPAKIEKIREETPDTKTFRLHFVNRGFEDSFEYKPGQFMELSLWGVGEAPISICSSPFQSRRFGMEFTIRAVGRVTQSIHNLKEKDTIYLRGPYGRAFPFEEIKGKDLLFVAGGLGLAPLRSLIESVFAKRRKFGRIVILYGAKNPDELLFKKQFQIWQAKSNTELHLTVDMPDEKWRGNIGVVTTLFNKIRFEQAQTISYICGPLIMIRFAVEGLLQRGFSQGSIYVSLERHMKCGIGKCGHCNIGEKFVCIDGPVFRWDEIKNL